MKKYRAKEKRGVLLFSVLVVTVIVVMFMGALLLRSRQNLFQSAHYRDGVKAEQAARAGINHALALLEEDPTWNNDLQATWSGATYTITFDETLSAFSVNNLNSTLAATQTSFQGYEVAPASLDLLVVGSCGISKRTLRVVVKRGYSSLRSVSAVGKITLSGDVEIDGIKSLLPPPNETVPESAPGGLLSKYRSTGPGDSAITWSGGNNFSLGELSELETAPPLSGGQGVSSNLAAQFPTQVVENGAADSIPEIDVEAKVASGMSWPSLAPGGSVLNGNVYSDSNQSVDGDLTITGDIVLTEGVIYIDGNLNLTGGIKGRGTVYVSGDVTMLGGSTLVQAAEPSGTALVIGGSADLQGIDAEGYLAALSNADPAIAAAYANLSNKLSAYEQNDAAATTYYWDSKDLTKHVGNLVDPNSGVWISPLPGPDGTHYKGYKNGIIPALTLAIKDTGLHLTDPRALKVVKALEEMHYHFRDNGAGSTVDLTGLSIDDDYQLVQSGTTLSQADVEVLSTGRPWDDAALPLHLRTHTALGYNNGPYPHPLANEYAHARRNAYINNNPIDFSWLGDSTFQGTVYARGNVTASHGFKVIGALTSTGNVTLTGGSKLIFNEEYRDLLAPDSSLGVHHFEEL